jgi:flavodoxin
MKIGIIVHSHTGNTLSVAQRMKDAFCSLGHDATIDRVKAVGEDPSKPGPVELETVPDTSDYDLIIFAGPVNGFSASRVMKEYLSLIPSLKGKPVCIFVTQQLKKAWMGGNRTVKQMRKACEEKGAAVLKTGVINWSNIRREWQIERLLNHFTKI